MVFIMYDDNGGTVLFIPTKREGVDVDLLAMCGLYATPVGGGI
jgi:hypothetical protein